MFSNTTGLILAKLCYKGLTNMSDFEYTNMFSLQILQILSENAVAVRTKAMKCLTAVVEADPGILARVRNKSLFSLFDFNYEK